MGNFDNFVSLDLGKLAEDDSRFGRGKRVNRLKVQVGQPRVIRILRGPTDSTFYRVRSQHWGIPVGHGNTPPLACSRKHADEPCYFCEMVNEYFNSGDPRQADLGRKMKIAVSVLLNVIDVKDPYNEDGTPKVLLWNPSWKLFQEVRAYFRDPDYGDLTHPVSGRNFKISSSKVSSQGGRDWTRYELQVGAKPTELEAPEALDHLYDLDSTFPVKLYSYEQQTMIFDGTWDPRTSSAALPASAASSAPKLTSTVPSTSDDEFETSSTNADDEFETADDDEWDDVLDDDSGKQVAMKKKLAELKEAARAK